MSYLGKWLEDERKRRGIENQTDWAKVLHISQPYYSQIVNGYEPVKKVMEIEKTLNLSPFTLVKKMRKSRTSA